MQLNKLCNLNITSPVIDSNGIITHKPLSNGGVHSKLNGGVHNKPNGGVHFKLNGDIPNFHSNLTTFSSPKLNGLVPSLKPTWSLPVAPVIPAILTGSSSTGGFINQTNSSNSFAVPNCQNYYVAHSCSHQG